MKKPIIFLVFLIVLMIIILPLILVSLGRLKNPVDQFAANSSRGALSGNGGISTMNYIPESGTYGTPSTISQDRTESEKRFRDCVKGLKTSISETYLISKDELSKNLIKMSNIAEWTLNGIKLKKVSGDARALHSLAIRLDDVDASTCSVPPADLLAYIHDTGVFAKAVATEETTLTGKGLMTISGLRYYWYLSEWNTQLDLLRPKKSNTFRAVYSGIYGGKVSVITFVGSTDDYSGERDFLRQTQVWLTGIRYLPIPPAPAAAESAQPANQPLR